MPFGARRLDQPRQPVRDPLQVLDISDQCALHLALVGVHQLAIDVGDVTGQVLFQKTGLFQGEIELHGVLLGAFCSHAAARASPLPMPTVRSRPTRTCPWARLAEVRRQRAPVVGGNPRRRSPLLSADVGALSADTLCEL